VKYWLVVTSPKNFRHDREILNFKMQGIPYRYRKTVQNMQIGDRIVYYVMTLQKFGAITSVSGDYIEDHSKMWTDDDEMWPSRRPTKPEIVLQDDELIDTKKLVPNLSFIENKNKWGVYFQGSMREIPEEDFRFIESEMKKVIAERKQPLETVILPDIKMSISENDFENLIMELSLETKSLHDRLGEMLEQIGSWMDFNTQTRHRITPEHAYELDVAWLNGKNPEVAIEIQISGNLTEAKDRLAQARKFNYRKVIIVIRESEMTRLNALMKHEPELRSWMEAWSIGAIYEMYKAGETFFHYYRHLNEAIYVDKKELDIVK
jgi:predicted RNA-binding protein